MIITFSTHNAYIQGGAQGVLLDLVKGIRKIHPEYRIYVIFPDRGNLIDLFLPYIDGYTVIKQPWWMVDPGKKSLYKSLWTLIRIYRYAYKTLYYLKQISPDVVMTNTIASPVTALACKKGGYKHFWFIHEVPIDSGSFNFLYPEYCIVKWIEKNSSRVLAVSDYVLKHYRKLMLDSNKICRIHYAVEINQSVKHEKRSTCYTLLLVGYFNDNKGQKEAIEACRIFKKNHSMPFRLLLVGAGKDSYSDMVREYIRTNCIDYVELVDFSTQINEYYNQADVLLMCSASEGLPRVVVEAQKMGLPVIATSIDANKELIRDGYNGLLYDRGDIDALAYAIWKLSDSSLKEKMSTNALHSMSQCYTMESFVERFICIICR